MGSLESLGGRMEHFSLVNVGQRLGFGPLSVLIRDTHPNSPAIFLPMLIL